MSSSGQIPTRARRKSPGNGPAGASALSAKPGKGATSVHAQPGAAASGKPVRARTNAELVHELEVHQVELEMQNEELRTAQLELAAAHDRLVDLYDFAPVGYFTLDAKGQVTQANLTGAALLGTARNALPGRGFSRFVVPAQADKWQRHLRQVWQADGARRVELVLRKPSGDVFHGQLDCVPTEPARGVASLRVTLTDITQRKLAEMDRQIADCELDAREAERRQVARELHEGLGQRLSVLKMELASLPLNGEAAVVCERVGAMLESLDDAVASVRRIATDLRPLMLDDLGLPAAIDWLANDLGRRMGLSVRLDLREPASPVDDHASTAMYRMAQAILEHVAHAATFDGIDVSMQQHATALILKVRCNARPGVFDGADSAQGAAQPVQALHDRARVLGGRLEITVRPQHGLSIDAYLPLNQPQLSSRMPERRRHLADRRKENFR